MDNQQERWHSEEVADKYLSNIRGGIPYADDQIEIMLRLIRACDFQDINFIDIGCGDGVLAWSIMEIFPQSKGVLMDFNKEMLTQAAKKSERFPDRARIIQADYATTEWLKLLPDSYMPDIIVSGFSIHHQPENRIIELYKEFYDLLKPGGLFINIEHTASASPWLQNIFDNYFIDSLYSYQVTSNPSRRREQTKEDYHKKEKHDLIPAVIQCEWLKQTGFSDVDIYFKVFEIAIFGGRKI